MIFFVGLKVFEVTETKTVSSLDPSVLIGQLLHPTEDPPMVIGLKPNEDLDKPKEPSLFEKKYKNVLSKFPNLQNDSHVNDLVNHAHQAIYALFNSSEHQIKSMMGDKDDDETPKLPTETFGFYVLEALGSITALILGAIGQINMAFNHSNATNALATA